MLNRLRAFRERGWREVDAPTYAQAWQRFGGSVATHPLVVEQLAEMAGIPVRYLGWESAGELVAAIPTWGRHLALSKDVLKRRGKKGLYDLGNAELILPVADDARIALRHAGRYLSALHERNIVTLRPQTEQLAFARAPEDFSKKFRYNQRREVRLVEEAGGQVRQADSFAPAEFAAIYLELFQRRWGFPATGAERMAEVFERLRELLRGSVLLLNDQPIAVQGTVSRRSAGLAQRRVHQRRRRSADPRVQPWQRAQLPEHPGRLGGCASAGQTPALFVRSRRPRIQGSLVPSFSGLPGLKHERTQAAVAQASSTQQADRPTGCAAGIAGRRSAGQPLVVADPPRGPVGRPRSLVRRSPVLFAGRGLPLPFRGRGRVAAGTPGRWPSASRRRAARRRYAGAWHRRARWLAGAFPRTLGAAGRWRRGRCPGFRTWGERLALPEPDGTGRAAGRGPDSPARPALPAGRRTDPVACAPSRLP